MSKFHEPLNPLIDCFFIPFLRKFKKTPALRTEKEGDEKTGGGFRMGSTLYKNVSVVL